MNDLLERHLGAIGARARVRRAVATRRSPAAVTLDVGRDRKGEFFDIALPPDARAEVVNTTEDHALLVVSFLDQKSRYLFGHDERHLFVAAIPESVAGVTTVSKARDALQPAPVAAAAAVVRPKMRQKHRAGGAYSRQGEWFFLPAPDLRVDDDQVLRNEPLQRGRGRPHVAEFCHRRGGETVYVDRSSERTLSQVEFESLDQHERRGSWRVMVRDAEVYVRGRITHPEHRTRVLRGWHRVLPNTEGESRAMRHVAFLD